MSRKKISKKIKLSILLFSILMGVAGYFCAYAHFESKLTDWQKKQKIDFDAQTGSTKFKAHIDAVTVGGLSLCCSALVLLSAVKIFTKK